MLVYSSLSPSFTVSSFLKLLRLHGIPPYLPSVRFYHVFYTIHLFYHILPSILGFLLPLRISRKVKYIIRKYLISIVGIAGEFFTCLAIREAPLVYSLQLFNQKLVVIKDNDNWRKGLIQVEWVSEWSSSVVSNSLRPHGLCLSGSAIHRIVQAIVLKWVAISSF